MLVEIIPRVGGQPIRVEAAQLIVYNDEITPVCVAGEYGPQGTIKVSHPGDEDFNRTLRAFGYGGPIIQIESVDANPRRVPRGAKLISGPQTRK